MNKIIYLLITIYIFIAAMQIPSLIKQKYWRELVAFSLFITLAFTFSLLISLDVKIPSPLKVIQYDIQDKYNLKYQQE